MSGHNGTRVRLSPPGLLTTTTAALPSGSRRPSQKSPVMATKSHDAMHAAGAAHTTHAAFASQPPSQPGRAKQPSLATLMMLKKRIGDIRAKQRRNRHVKRQENSYQLGPDPAKRYSAPEVRHILDNSLKFFLGESRYDPKASPKLAKMVSEDVKRRMKNNFNCPRYKLVVMVTVTQKVHQHVTMASRLVADAETDDFVTSTLERPTLLACASAFWFYCE